MKPDGSKYHKIQVKKILTSRYSAVTDDTGLNRPQNWSDRKDGIDTIETDTGETLRLYSTGQQSSPKVGWIIVLTGTKPDGSSSWTLFGMPRDY